MTSQEAWVKQNERIEYYKKTNPGLLAHKKKRAERQMLDEIGAYNVPKEKLPGYIRLFPQDFIVEEKMSDGRIFDICSIKSNEIVNKEDEKNNTLYAKMIKIGIPTNVAVERIAHSLNISANKIGYAGLKDSDAITAQLIAFPGVKKTTQEILDIKIPNVFLTGFYYSKGSLNPGDLAGNIFTITVRTKSGTDDNFRLRFDLLNKYGILNYFQTQRFGGLRLMSHKLGKLIMRGEYENAVRDFLFKTNEDDIELVRIIRRSAEDAFPNWKKIYEIMLELPYMFANELRLLDFLVKEPDNYVGALIQIEDQTQLWLYAYSSWLFNKYLSAYTGKNGCVSEKFPTLFSDESKDIKLYEKYLREDGTENFVKYVRPFKFIQYKKRLVPGRIFPENVICRPFDGGVVTYFTLPKGCYATTFLTNLFELHQGLPIPEWVNLKEINPKEILGRGSISEIKEIFKDYNYSKQDLA